MRERFVLLGLAPARADWFRTVGQWAAAAVLPAEFIRCLSVDELRGRLLSGRAFSAVLIDQRSAGLDRDLVAAAVDVGCAVVVVADGATTRDWRQLGAAAILAPMFSRDELLEVLAAVAQPVGDGRAPDLDPDDRDPGSARGTVIAVTGPGGTGASITAVALAQGLAAGDQSHGARRSTRGVAATSTSGRTSSVLLADLCREADQAMYHDSRVLVPGLQELVDAHRSGLPSRSVVLDQTFEVPARGYRLLLGLRRSRHWIALRPRALEAAYDSLERTFRYVVADVDHDLEGQAETNSPDVEERHLLARASVVRAGVVIAVGEPSTKGVFALTRVIASLLATGAPAGRILPVFARSSRRPRARAELTAALGQLTAATAGVAAGSLPAAIHLPSRPVETALRDGVAVPAPLPATLARAVTAVLERNGAPQAAPLAAPARVVPGSLSAYVEDEP